MQGKDEYAPVGEDGRSEGSKLRLWPGFALVGILWIGRYGVPALAPEATWIGVLSALLAGPLLGVWWIFFSRARGFDRWGGGLLVLAPLLAMYLVLDRSVAEGMMGLLFPLYVGPPLSLFFVLWASFGGKLSETGRRLALLAVVALCCVPFALLRTGGLTGSLESDFAWRWSPTPEELLVEEEASVKMVALAESRDGSSEGVGEWPGFRGPERKSLLRDVRIQPDWEARPPEELWRRPVGPGWSSFAVRGDRLFTQEQRGDDELVACYRVTTGEPVWRHRDETRFWESIGGAGPRATPTYHDGRIYALGATGLLNALEADSGALVWSRNAAEDTGAKLPGWGFSGSPLVHGELVIVAVAGHLIAYDRESGERRWEAPSTGSGYSSPQLLEVDGVAQLVFLGQAGATGMTIEDGAPLWEYGWEGEPIVQPALTEDGDLLIAVGAQSGLRRVDVRRDGDGWAVQPLWTSIRLKPYYNDFVVHEGHAYGFDGSILACIELEQGRRRWKGGRYGQGQLLLLADQDVLIVVGEHGQLVLVSATPEDFQELSRIQALEGKTWNHPALVGDVLLVRNAEEMAAYRISLLDQ